MEHHCSQALRQLLHDQATSPGPPQYQNEWPIYPVLWDTGICLGTLEVQATACYVTYGRPDLVNFALGLQGFATSRVCCERTPAATARADIHEFQMRPCAKAVYMSSRPIIYCKGASNNNDQSKPRGCLGPVFMETPTMISGMQGLIRIYVRMVRFPRIPQQGTAFINNPRVNGTQPLTASESRIPRPTQQLEPYLDKHQK